MFLHLAKSAFQPEEVAELRAVFDDVTSQPWFRKDAKEEFARYLFKSLPPKIDDARAFRATMETTARQHFSYGS